MDDDKLNSFQQNELKWLRRQVDRLQDETFKKSPLPNAQNDLWVARTELERYVSDLRSWGKKI